MAEAAKNYYQFSYAQPEVEARPSHLRIVSIPTAPRREFLSLRTYQIIFSVVILVGLFTTVAIEGLTTIMVHQKSYFKDQNQLLVHQIENLETVINKRLSLGELDKHANELGMVPGNTPGFVQSSPHQFEMAKTQSPKLAPAN